MTILFLGSSRSQFFFKLTTDQVLGFYWIPGSGKVNLLYAGPGCLVQKPDDNPGLTVNRNIIFLVRVQKCFSLLMFCLV